MIPRPRRSRYTMTEPSAAPIWHALHVVMTAYRIIGTDAIMQAMPDRPDL